MRGLDCVEIISKAWKAYDGKKQIKTVADVSAKVSTNFVYKIIFTDNSFILTKLSFFGKFEIFLEDHRIINALANVLPEPYDKFLALSLTKDGELFTYRFTSGVVDVWVVFYNAVEIREKLPRRLDDHHITNLGNQLGKFHKACDNVKDQLPHSSRTIQNDTEELIEHLKDPSGKCGHGKFACAMLEQCDILLENLDTLNYESFNKIPVFIDWNIGNFSITEQGEFFSRWDYDWFRMSSRVMDFYFFSRVCSDIGDRTVFSYLPGTLVEDRFLLFLKSYHEAFPLTAHEVLFIKESYRFFILNYVVKHGAYFFTSVFARRLQNEAHNLYFRKMDAILDVNIILKSLNL